jgi:ABC-type multidrug transport system fused ATPase/permease subunit
MMRLMSSVFEHPIKIEVNFSSTHPHLLQGLDIWLQLGLLSDTQVKQLCQEFLICRVVLQPQIIPEPSVKTSHDVETVQYASLQGDGFVHQDNPPQAAPEPGILARMLQSLRAEFSVRWLLFLGMFLVVMSSGVLAASQWENFPSFGQYGIVLAYTLSFWGVSFWASKQPNLTLTTQALTTISLLLVPVNFWAMDSFQLWQNPFGWVLVAIGSVFLTAITLFLNSLPISTSTRGGLFRYPLPILNILGLSYLHWGWKIPGFPSIAVYIAILGTTIATVYQIRRQEHLKITVTAEDWQRGFGIKLSYSVIIYALALLLIRAIFVVQVNVQELGLAIGICGWLVAWVASRGYAWEFIGGILLFLGWVVSIGTAFPWQATVVSCLGLWFFNQRLHRNGKQADVGAIFVIGLQTIWLGWRLVPSQLQEWAIATATQLTDSQNVPSWALLSVGLFPYVILMLILADRLLRVGKIELAKVGEELTLLFGMLLTLVSLLNPTLRSLNFILSTITLAIVSQRRSPTRISLVYMTQFTGVLTFCSIVDLVFPYLSHEVWASILLAAAVVEWLASIGCGIWRRSAWHFGLGLAGLSYALLWMNAESAWYGFRDSSHNWSLIWLMTPVTLTAIATIGLKNQTHRITRPIISSWLSVTALGLSNLLTLPLPGARLIGLAVSAILMWLNTYNLKYKINARITVGYCLGFIALLLWEGVPGLLPLSLQGWFLVGAIAIFGLWLMHQSLRRKNHTLVALYADATNKWAISLCIVELLVLSFHSLLVYQALAQPGFLYLTSSGIILGAIIYRSWQQPTLWGFYGIGWCLELLVAEVLGFTEGSLIKIAIANIALGLITQLVGEWWQRRHHLSHLPNRWHILPLLYGILGIVLRWNTFANWTGLSSLIVALIVIGVGRRRRKLKPLTYLGLIGVSISIYELLLYQLLQASGGALGDGLIAMSVLGTGIMYTYRILSPWLVKYLRLTNTELRTIAHIHWAVSSCLLLCATFTPIAFNRLVGLGTGVFLIRYAIFQGRYRNLPPVERSNTNRVSTAEIWVYLGFLEIFAMRIYWNYTAVGRFLAGALLPWSAPIASVFSYFLYILPWERWGWSKKPWQQAAYILPIVYLWESKAQIYPIALLLTAGFYIFLAKITEKFRFTYISVVLIDWAILRWLWDLNFTGTLWYVIIMGLSLLYIAQFDPSLKLSNMKTSRHLLRLLGCGVICGWAIIFHQNTGVIPGVFSLIAIFTGLALRVRAFLFVGVTTFFVTGFYQLVVLIFDYALLKWLIGLLVGIMLIAIAANFETRREQLNSLLRKTTEELDKWD